MTLSEFSLAVIAVSMVVLVTQLSGIASRLKKRFPTQAEEERDVLKNNLPDVR